MAKTLIISASSSSSSSSVIDMHVSDDNFDDACSICLEPFCSLDPPSITKCKHEYHLQCILEWSQRSNECPICSQHLVLKDPTSSPELLQLAGIPRVNILSPQRDFNPVNQQTVFQGALTVNDSDPERTIRQRFAAFTKKARSRSRRTHNTSNVTQINTSSAFSESFKSKISTASSRYKESIWKSTRGFKEKLLARNGSVKELSKGVQHEMNAGIAGIVRMIEWLDITHKRAS